MGRAQFLNYLRTVREGIMMDVLIRVRATYPNADKSEGINSLRGTCNAEEWSASRLIRARAHLITLGISRVAKNGSGSFVIYKLDFGRFGRLGGHAPPSPNAKKNELNSPAPPGRAKPRRAQYE